MCSVLLPIQESTMVIILVLELADGLERNEQDAYH